MLQKETTTSEGGRRLVVTFPLYESQGLTGRRGPSSEVSAVREVAKQVSSGGQGQLLVQRRCQDF